MATNKFVIFFHDGNSLDRTVVEADTEQEARDVFVTSNPDDRILKVLGPQASYSVRDGSGELLLPFFIAYQYQCLPQ